MLRSLPYLPLFFLLCSNYHGSLVCAVSITYPPSLRRRLGFAPATFGCPYYTAGRYTGSYPIIFSSPRCGCDSLIERSHENNTYSGKIVVVFRGECTFVTKAQVVQKAGGVGLLVIDEDVRRSEDLMIMTDDGDGHKVLIPSARISFRDGQKLRRVYQDSLIRSVLRLSLTHDMTSA